jgi:short-subunit dehydrogenase
MEVPLDRQLAQLEVNLRGVIQGSHAAASRMQRGATIVNIGSLAGRIPLPGSAVYSATKAGVLAFTEALDAELRSQGIRVCAVLPSFTNTELIAGTEAKGMTKPVEPTDVAAAVVRVLRRPRLYTVVPRTFALSGATWSACSPRVKPLLRRAFGLDRICTEPDRAARAAYDERTFG